jgi:hypothetical protein
VLDQDVCTMTAGYRDDAVNNVAISGGAGVDLQLLGPVRLWVAGRPVGVGVRMQRFVLAVLALEANRLVTTDRLIELTWPDQPPATARRVIQTQISRPTTSWRSRWPGN